MVEVEAPVAKGSAASKGCLVLGLVFVACILAAFGILAFGDKRGSIQQHCTDSLGNIDVQCEQRVMDIQHTTNPQDRYHGQDSPLTATTASTSTGAASSAHSITCQNFYAIVGNVRLSDSESAQ